MCGPQEEAQRREKFHAVSAPAGSVGVMGQKKRSVLLRTGFPFFFRGFRARGIAHHRLHALGYPVHLSLTSFMSLSRDRAAHGVALLSLLGVVLGVVAGIYVRPCLDRRSSKRNKDVELSVAGNRGLESWSVRPT